jgi:predicted AlkP superfamily phosphohydrolase/phosphomutase
VLAVGLDACSWPLVERLIEAGQLPALERFAATSSSAALRTPASYRAELSWTAFVSGRTPEQTAYWGTVAYDPATYRAREAGAFHAAPFYAGLGVPVVAVDVPHAVPWPGMPGAQVIAWGAHSPQHGPAGEPAALVEAAVARVGAHPAFDADSQPGWHSGRYQEELVAALAEGARRRADLVVELMRRVPDWRLAVTVFSEPHSAGHHLWHGVDPDHPLADLPGAAAAGRRLAGVYRAVDRAFGRLLEAVGPATTVVLFSVHDTVANANDLPALYLVPELLHRDAHGWAALRDDAGRRPGPGGPIVPAPRLSLGAVIESRYRSHRGVTHEHPGLLDAARDRLRRWRRRGVGDAGPPPWAELAQHGARGLGPNSAGPGVTTPIAASSGGRPLDYLGTARYERWWARQPVFALPTFSDTHLRVNLHGRESLGSVPADAFDATLAAWERRLRALRDGRNGRPVVAEISRTRPSGEPCAAGPPADLVVRFAHPADVLEDPVVGRVGPLPFLRTGEHGPTGFVRARGAAGPVRLPSGLGPADLGRLLAHLLHA